MADKPQKRNDMSDMVHRIKVNNQPGVPWTEKVTVPTTADWARKIRKDSE